MELNLDFPTWRFPRSHRATPSYHPYFTGISICTPSRYGGLPIFIWLIFPQEALPLGLCAASAAALDAVVSGAVRVTLSDVTAQQLQVVTWQHRWLLVVSNGCLMLMVMLMLILLVLINVLIQ